MDPSALLFLTKSSSGSSSSSSLHSSSSIPPIIEPSSSSSSSSSIISSATPISSFSYLPHISPLSLHSKISRPLSSPSSSSSLPLPANPVSSSEGVVVVGVVGRNSEDVTHLINRCLDANIFGSGSQDKNLSTHFQKLEEKDEEACFEQEKIQNGVETSWFDGRRISYYYDEEKGIVFLQFISSGCSCLNDFYAEFDRGEASLPSILEQRDSGDLRGLLLMFSVCHVIIFLQEGSRFDTQILKKFRILQSAKHALAPFVKSHITPMTTSKGSNSSSQTNVPNSSNTSPPGRGRHGSAISLMSGSYPSLFPGQCTPALLFVFIDDFSDGPTNSGSHTEDQADATSVISTANLGSPSNQPSSLIAISRPNLPTKGSSSVVMLARPTNKTEGGFKKKLQSSLEAQIRFLIKKCRALAGGDGSVSGSGPRSCGNMSSISGAGIGWTLFFLDASRAVALLDKSTNHKGESLNFVTGLIEEVLNGKAASDVLLLENHSQIANKEDIQSIREFIYRQSDTLRGRGGLPTNAASGGSAPGVGMVAVAAAAAAASAASGSGVGSGKSFCNPPELPSLEKWLWSSRLLLDALVFSAKPGIVDESESKRETSHRTNATKGGDGVGPTGMDAVEAAISCLESGMDLNMKFSMSWCQRALPAANEVYMKGLPPCYSTVLHEAQLEKALCAFHLMVKGPAVEIFSRRLRDELTNLWKSGRQLCDAVSLTGKPCMHQTHDVDRPHCSGFFFLHACACGRSRRLREDPFDLDSANVGFNCFPDCDNLLPSLLLPDSVNAGPLRASTWSLVRVGGLRYYEPSKGLLQSGFCSAEKFLFKWLILLEKRKGTNGFLTGDIEKSSLVRTAVDSKVEFVEYEEPKNVGATQFSPARIGGQENQKKPAENIPSDDPKISFGRGLPVFEMKKPFAEVVATSIAADSAFPPLQQRKQPAHPEKGTKQRGVRDRIGDGVHAIGGNHGSVKCEDTFVRDSVGSTGQTGIKPVLRIGSNMVPVNVNSSGKIKPTISLKHVVVYVGFEHECSHGHRFLLSPEHLSKLGSPYSLSRESHIISSAENFDSKLAELPDLGKNGKQENIHLRSLGTTHAGLNQQKAANRSKERVADRNQHSDMVSLFSGKKQNQPGTGLLTLGKSGKDPEGSLQYLTLDDGGGGFSLLNRNLPIYMNCPHCKISKGNTRKNLKFASTISQLQRIFIVTPPFPTVLATCPLVQFESSCLPPSVWDRDQQSQFSLGCRVILPPESFVSLKLPFIYSVLLDDNSLYPLKYLDHQPELTAWVTKGTVLQVVSKGSDIDCPMDEIK